MLLNNGEETYIGMIERNGILWRICRERVKKNNYLSTCLLLGWISVFKIKFWVLALDTEQCIVIV